MPYDCGGSSCTGGCGSTCSDGCGINCTASCQSSCDRGNCTGCTGSCTAVCDSNCDGCSGCSGCGGCDGTCNGCDGCTGCGGCGACTGSCSGHCDNACKSDSAPTIIANLGANIKAKGVYSAANDFTDLRNKIRAEFTRRGRALPTNDTFNTIPANGVVVSQYHLLKIFTDEKFLVSVSRPTALQGQVITLSQVSATITNIQNLMSAIVGWQY